MMDYLPQTPPLSSYIEIHKLSLNSKIFILVNLANALRFLKDYSIVHMDLNLNNILVYRDLLTKVIDFGEAYSPKINNMGILLINHCFQDQGEPILFHSVHLSISIETEILRLDRIYFLWESFSIGQSLTITHFSLLLESSKLI